MDRGGDFFIGVFTAIGFFVALVVVAFLLFGVLL